MYALLLHITFHNQPSLVTLILIFDHLDLNEAWHAWEASGMSEAALPVAERLELEFFLALDKYADACEKRLMRHNA